MLLQSNCYQNIKYLSRILFRKGSLRVRIQIKQQQKSKTKRQYYFSFRDLTGSIHADAKLERTKS